jgi:hypothetical protein
MKWLNKLKIFSSSKPNPRVADNLLIMQLQARIEELGKTENRLRAENAELRESLCQKAQK